MDEVNDLVEIERTCIWLQYILESNAYPREHEQLKELRETTVGKFDKSRFVSAFLQAFRFFRFQLIPFDSDVIDLVGFSRFESIQLILKD